MKVTLIAAGILFSGSAIAAVPRVPLSAPPPVAHEAQYTRDQNRAIARCMRKTYGPHYFRGVRTQHRMAMLRACGVS